MRKRIHPNLKAKQTLIVLKKKTLQTILILFSSLSPLYAQYQLNGDAIALDQNCFLLTPEEHNKKGSVWFTPKIDLNESFSFTFELNFGCDDEGADGIVFGLHTSPDALGGGAGGLGFQHLVPALAVEFDTYPNNPSVPGSGDLSDPLFDHIAIFSGGPINHSGSNNLIGPVQTDPDNTNVKDCEYHEVRVVWDAIENNLAVYFDCQLRISYIVNIIDEIFQGESMVHWGFTSATGGASNEHIVCLENTQFIDPQEDYKMCKGGSIQLNAKGGQSYQWSPAEGLSNPNIANPLASPEVSTSYEVTITDACVQFFDTVYIEVVDVEVAFEFSDTTLCQGNLITLDATTENATYLWSTGETSPSITAATSGYYVVTVTVGTDCVANDAAQVNFLGLPDILFSEDTTYCIGTPIILNAAYPNSSYLWQDGSMDSIFIANESGTYSVMVKHFCGDKEFSKEVLFFNCTDLYIPNAFSPNFDGINDYFIILDGGDVINIKLLRILDRWGELVFEANDFMPNDRSYGWDGTFKGKPVSNGVYAYFSEILFRDGSRKIISGDVSVIR